jgi:hypothetical protein
MQRLVMLFLAVVVLLSLAPAAPAKQPVADAESIKAEAVHEFEGILDLWRAGDFGELYNRTLISGKDTKETFSRRMSAARLKPSCCWEKMQEVKVSVKGPSSVVIRARLGMDAPGEMVYKTKSFKLHKEDGQWRIARSEILALAEVKKGKGARKHHK